MEESERTVGWGEMSGQKIILHRYYKHKTIDEKMLLNFWCCLSLITFISCSHATLNNCF